MENKLEATMVYWGFIGTKEKNMEANIVYWDYIRVKKQEWKLLWYTGVM